ncbi:class 1b ribonucleoside-diphosphate reductase subunit beta [Aeromicrobium sp. 179-A 4D2 NHS]|uniref:class 1b ribonucleoside-diphosphate reductase subunit beta n=1 Tax=Aeromicrobium sp. 179-A 4D2 NHS TaxID=3142375 RepID=UPI0039A39608
MSTTNPSDVSPSYKGINWNNPEDPFDVQIYDQLISQFWIPERFTLSQDIKSWAGFSEAEKLLTMRVLTGLTVLDTLQGTSGAISLIPDAVTPQEEAWLSNIQFMETIHAKSYSSIFMTLCSTMEINDAFRWSEDNPELQFKASTCDGYYKGDDPIKRKVASVMLESFLFYSGFYLPLYWQSIGRLVNTGDMIKAIIRDEAVHGQAIGYKYQKAVEQLSAEKQEEYREFAYDLLEELYENEVRYTQDLYDGIGLTEDVKKFIRYNGNKALANLGYDPLFPKEDVNPAILNGLQLGAVTHDFFSATGSYAMAKVEEVSDDDFDFLD